MADGHFARMSSGYRAIFRSTLLVGVQQFVRLVAGVVQSKLVAVWLGASGTGAFGMYAALMNLGQNLFTLGLFSSGVRQIAAEWGDEGRSVPVSTIRVFLRAYAALAVAGGLCFVLFRKSLSRWSFGDSSHAAAVGYLGLALAAAMMAAARMSVLQGLRRLRAMTAANSLAALLGAAGAIGLVYRFRAAGIAPAFLAVSLCAWLSALLFSPRLPPAGIGIGSEARRILPRLFGLGSGFLGASLLAAASAYAVRVFLARSSGLEAVGLYQAGVMLATFYTGMATEAMSADFLPRICAAADRPPELHRQTHEQMESGLLILAPGVLLGAAGAPLLLQTFYSSAFLPALGAALWMLAGAGLRAAVWPLSCIPVALNRPKTIVEIEAAAAVALVLFSFVGIRMGGVLGAGIGFCAASVVYAALLTRRVRRLASFSWSRRLRRWGGGLAVAAIAIFVVSAQYDSLAARVVAALLAMATSLACAVRAWQLFFGDARPAAGGRNEPTN